MKREIIVGVSVVMAAILWELNRTDNLITAVGTMYVVLSVLVFTATCVVGLVYGVIRMIRLVEVGMEEEKVEIVREEQAKLWK